MTTAPWVLRTLYQLLHGKPPEALSYYARMYDEVGLRCHGSGVQGRHFEWASHV